MKKILAAARLDKSDSKTPKLLFRMKNEFLKDLCQFEDGDLLIIEVYKHYKKRTVDQNSFYYGVTIQEEIECFKERWGETYTVKEMHEWNKRHFWGEERLVEATGEIIDTPASSADQSTVQWEEKLEKMRQWFRQNFEWELSYPSEQKAMRYR